MINGAVEPDFFMLELGRSLYAELVLFFVKGRYKETQSLWTKCWYFIMIGLEKSSKDSSWFQELTLDLDLMWKNKALYQVGTSTGAGEISGSNSSFSHLHNKSEKEAAMAYDSAAIKLSNGDSQRNIPWSDVTIHKPNFQGLFSTVVVLNMIKDGSYASKFSDYMLARARVRYAVKYFPRISEFEELVFFDPSMKSWKFRYCYWKSSQSFVFTRSWNRFAKEKGIRPRDRIIFSVCKYRDGSNEVRKLCRIDVAYYDGVNKGKDKLQLQIARKDGYSDRGEEVEEMDLQFNGKFENASEEEREYLGASSTITEKKWI
ncbi:AP2 ERF and B3 domain-containing transcription factor At1g50680 [Olea europaea subsp. europaea]|uniref:AP2 ERF and B3 domain-containing transcription factor At1g50680 n=1 Tax=Olea europaea subsp. europaea TaxID=158383 RepID=A0A8S0U6L4_OLEEU|nr:AP2 ERF and B3 domain-containing transcription factor At1g50680 [Olea europaea subsp. europaea]